MAPALRKESLALAVHFRGFRKSQNLTLTQMMSSLTAPGQSGPLLIIIIPLGWQKHSFGVGGNVHLEPKHKTNHVININVIIGLAGQPNN